MQNIGLHQVQSFLAWELFPSHDMNDSLPWSQMVVFKGDGTWWQRATDLSSEVRVLHAKSKSYLSLSSL